MLHSPTPFLTIFPTNVQTDSYIQIEKYVDYGRQKEKDNLLEILCVDWLNVNHYSSLYIEGTVNISPL